MAVSAILLALASLGAPSGPLAAASGDHAESQTVMWSAMQIPACPAGQQRGEAGCEACARGRFRSEAMPACGPCRPGTYGDREGQAGCKACPVGANCTSSGLGRRPSAAEGYFFVERCEHKVERLCYHECEPSVCVGGNRCVDSNDGVLCQSCKVGHTHHGFGGIGGGGVCRECPPPAQSALAVAAILVVYMIGAAVLMRLAAAAAGCLQDLRCAMIKIVLSWALFFYISASATGLFWPPSIGQPDSALAGSLKCLLALTPWRAMQAHIVASTFIIPLLVLANLVRIGVQGLVAALGACLQRDDGAPGQEAPAPSPQAQEEVLRVSTSPNVTEHSYDAAASSTASPQVTVSQTEATRISVAEGVPTPAIRLLGAGVTRWMRQVGPSACGSSLVLVFLAYPMVVTALLQGLVCQELGGQRRLLARPDAECLGDEHLRLAAWSLAGLALHGVGVPLLLLFLLWRSRLRLSSLVSQQSLGFLYNGFKQRCCYFEIVHFFEKLVILAVCSIPQGSIRCTFMLILSLTFFGIHKWADPFDARDHRILDRMQVLNLWSLIITTLCKVLLMTSGSSHGARGQAGMWLETALMSWQLHLAARLVAIAGHLAFLACAVDGFARSTLVRPLLLRSEAGEQLSCWQQMLLRRNRAAGLGNKVVVGTAGVDVSKLSKKEQNLLNLALNATLRRYINCSSELQPSLLMTAVREAEAACRTRRKERLQALQLESRRPQQWWRRAESPAGAGGEQLEGRFARALELEGVLVEDLQEALMALWPRIEAGWAELKRGASRNSRASLVSRTSLEERSECLRVWLKDGDDEPFGVEADAVGSWRRAQQTNERLASKLTVERAQTAELAAVLRREARVARRRLNLHRGALLPAGVLQPARPGGLRAVRVP